MTKNNLRIVIINSEQWKTINLMESNSKSGNSNGDKMTSSQWLVISPMDSI